MADRTPIEWTDATWTPIKGCSRHSPGCINCYAEIMAARFSHPGQWGEGLARIIDTPQGKDHRWTGSMRFDDGELLKPLGWKKPRRIFVCSTSDLFHESVPDEWIDKVFAVMALCPQHVFQVLTKRADRMRVYMERWYRLRFAAERPLGVTDAMLRAAPALDADRLTFSALPVQQNIWLGVSAENQHWLMQRAPHLVEIPAAVLFLSLEPCLSEMDIEPFVLPPRRWSNGWANNYPLDYPKRQIDWVIVGGESGPGARPMSLDAARSLRDQCAKADIPFFFKQWGAHVPCGQLLADGRVWTNGSNSTLLTTKKVAGRFLDRVQHNGMPT